LNPFDIIIYSKKQRDSSRSFLSATVYVQSNCSDSFAICQIAIEYQSNPFSM